MIIIRIKKFTDYDSMSHVATSWQIATDKDFNNILEEELESTTMLNVYFTAREVPKDMVYYARYKRHFEGDYGDTNWINTDDIYNITESYDNMVLAEDVVVYQPTVIASKADIESTNKTFTVRTSSFKSNVDLHDATHWFLLDSTNKVLYASVYDKTNLTSIAIPNDVSYRNKTELRFVVIHVGATGAESKPGTLKIKMTSSSSFNFEISSSITGVAPLENLTIQFSKVSSSATLGIVSVELLDFNTKEVILALDIDSDNCVYIPWYLLKENMKYKLKIVAYDTSYVQGTLYKDLTVADFTQYVIRDQDKVYSKTLSSFSDTLTLSNNIHTEELFNQTVLFPDASNLTMKVYKYDTVTNRLKDTGATANGIKLLSSNISYMLIRPISKALVIIDQYNDSKYPTFSLYSYDNNSDTYTLLQTKMRTDEEYPVGKNISFLQINSEEFLYMPYNLAVIRRYNIIDDTITDKEVDLDTIEGDDSITASTETTTTDETIRYVAARNRYNRIFLFNSKIDNAAMYNHVRDTITTGYSFGPVNFRDKNLKTIPLVDGSTLVMYESEYVKTQEEEEDKSWEDYGSLQHYDYATGTMECLYKNFSGSYPTSSILVNNGNLFLYTNSGSTTYFYMYT